MLKLFDACVARHLNMSVAELRPTARERQRRRIVCQVDKRIEHKASSVHDRHVYDRFSEFGVAEDHVVTGPVPKLIEPVDRDLQQGAVAGAALIDHVRRHESLLLRDDAPTSRPCCWWSRHRIDRRARRPTLRAWDRPRSLRTPENSG